MTIFHTVTRLTAVFISAPISLSSLSHLSLFSLQPHTLPGQQSETTCLYSQLKVKNTNKLYLECHPFIKICFAIIFPTSFTASVYQSRCDEDSLRPGVTYEVGRRTEAVKRGEEKRGEVSDDHCDEAPPARPVIKHNR